MLTLEELIIDCKSRAAEEDTTWFSDEDWIRWLNEGQQAVVRNTRILQRSVDLAVGPAQAEFPLPNDMWLPRLVLFDGNTLTPISLEDVEQRPAVGGTYAYVVWGDRLRLYPAPSRPGTLTIYYFAWPKRMREPGDVPEIPEAFHGTLVTYALYRQKLADQKPVEADRLYAEFQNNLLELVGAYSERQEQYHRVRDVMGGF